MDHRIGPEQAKAYLKTREALDRFGEKVPPEVFRWLAWITAIAAVKVIAIRTGAWWFSVVAVVLSLLLIGRVQWFVNIDSRETRHADGSIVFHFQWWRNAAGLVIGVCTWAFAFGAADVIARSNLLPIHDTPAQLTAPAPEAKR